MNGERAQDPVQQSGIPTVIMSSPAPALTVVVTPLAVPVMLIVSPAVPASRFTVSTVSKLIVAKPVRVKLAALSV